jgi:hypothetical protein
VTKLLYIPYKSSLQSRRAFVRACVLDCLCLTKSVQRYSCFTVANVLKIRCRSLSICEFCKSRFSEGHADSLGAVP